MKSDKTVKKISRNEVLKIVVQDSFSEYSIHENLGYSTTAFNLQKGEGRYNNFIFMAMVKMK